MVHGVNKKKAKFRASFLQPLSIVEIDVYHVPAKNIQSIKRHTKCLSICRDSVSSDKEFTCIVHFRNIVSGAQTNWARREFISFLENSVRALDCCDDSLANFHLVFMIKLSRYLGFAPNNDGEEEVTFDLLNGVFTQEKLPHVHLLQLM